MTATMERTGVVGDVVEEPWLSASPTTAHPVGSPPGSEPDQASAAAEFFGACLVPGLADILITAFAAEAARRRRARGRGSGSRTQWHAYPGPAGLLHTPRWGRHHHRPAACQYLRGPRC